MTFLKSGQRRQIDSLEAAHSTPQRMAFITNFFIGISHGHVTLATHQILTQEDWNVVLFNGMEKTSHWAALYFVALMTFGNYVLFNLLVAILVEGFSAEVRAMSFKFRAIFQFQRTSDDFFENWADKATL
jgi:Ion transport protein